MIRVPDMDYRSRRQDQHTRLSCRRRVRTHPLFGAPTIRDPICRFIGQVTRRGRRPSRHPSRRRISGTGTIAVTNWAGFSSRREGEVNLNLCHSLWLVGLVMLHRVDGVEVFVNPGSVTSLHSPGSGKLLPKGHCALWLTDGRLLTVVEPCAVVRRLLEEAR